MRIRVSPPLFLVIGATVAVLLGCSSAPASSTTDDTSSPPPAAAADTQPPPDSVDIGYEVDLRAPEFGMSLPDGGRVTSSDLTGEGKPVFLYFHATF